MSEERRAAWAKVNKKSGIAKALHNLVYWTGIDIEPIQAVVENPELQLAAVKTCPKCKGKGCFPAARLMAGNTSFLTCNICRGKGLVIVDPEVEKPLPSFADVKGIFNNEETGGGE